MISDIERPSAIPLMYGHDKIATAYANHKPSPRCKDWGWYMKLPKDKKAYQLGRLPNEDAVRQAMMKKCNDLRVMIGNKKESDITDVRDLLRSWFAEDIEARAPGSSLRKEYQISARTVSNHTQASKYICSIVGDVLLKSLHQSNIETLIQKMMERYAPRTIKLYLSSLKQALHWYCKQGFEIPHFEFNPPRVDKNEDNEKKDIPEIKDMENLYASLRNCRLRLGLYIGMHTGARVGEIGNLKWNDFIEEDGDYYVRLNGKTGSRYFPISLRTLLEIYSYRTPMDKDDERIFSKSFHNHASTQLQKSCVLRGIKPFKFHGIRRYMVKRLMSDRIEQSIYEKIMGHSYKMGSEVYRNPTKKELSNTIIKEMSDSDREIMEMELKKQGRSICRRNLSEDPIDLTRQRVA